MARGKKNQSTTKETYMGYIDGVTEKSRKITGNRRDCRRGSPWFRAKRD